MMKDDEERNGRGRGEERKGELLHPFVFGFAAAASRGTSNACDD